MDFEIINEILINKSLQISGSRMSAKKDGSQNQCSTCYIVTTREEMFGSMYVCTIRMYVYPYIHMFYEKHN